MFLKDAPEKQKIAVQDFYDRLSPHFKSLWGPHLHDGYYKTGQETREQAQEQLVEFLASRARIPRGARVLDIGCGLGATSVWLAEHGGCRPTGITLSSVQVEMATKLAQEKGVEADFLVMDAEDLSFDQPFEALWMLGVLGHLPNQERFLRGAHRLVQSGGRFLLTDWTLGENVSQVDYKKFVVPVIKGMLMPEIVPRASYLDWLEETGFQVIETHDLTNETAKTWDQGLQIVEAPQVVKLALSLGRDALDLLTAVYYMKKAMKKGLICYSVVVAEKL